MTCLKWYKKHTASVKFMCSVKSRYKRSSLF